MLPTDIDPQNSIFVILSFEGPDIYAQAGGLGVRITNLAQALAGQGFPTHLFFIGDPRLKGEEKAPGSKLILHRWCQWISAYHPLGCYQGEESKVADYTASIAPFVTERIIQPALNQNQMVFVLAEEWHTTRAVCRLHELLIKKHIRDKVVMFWNANNTFGFEHINFPQLSKACTITTVSRYMKHIMWQSGLNPIVIPNGIPKNLLEPVNTVLSASLRRSLRADLVLTKIARWDPDKRWNMAIEAVAGLKARGLKTKLIARGGMEGYGEEVLNHASSAGLTVKDVYTKEDTLNGYLKAIAAAGPEGDVLNLKFYCPQDLLRIIYRAADGVLANSGREPFGLVGLEAMAAGGIAYTGSTGEDYAVPFHNAIVLETSDPQEIESYVTFLNNHPEEVKRIRKSGQYTAAQFTWDQVIENLIQRLEYQAKAQGLLTLAEKPEDLAEQVLSSADLLSSGGPPWKKNAMEI
jgi:glycosyltransferase involved in cell wall biosynthesis